MDGAPQAFLPPPGRSAIPALGKPLLPMAVRRQGVGSASAVRRAVAAVAFRKRAVAAVAFRKLSVL